MQRLLYFLFMGLLSPSFIFAQASENLRLEVIKSRRVLNVYKNDVQIKTYKIALGNNPIPAKKIEGDGATPEGNYFICNKNPKSKFYLSLGITYPGLEDAKRGLKESLISKQEYEAIMEAYRKKEKPPWNTKLGGEIFIHGNGNKPDWTLGCVALDDRDMRELYELVLVGTSIEIKP